jgi:hypothetical protein
MSERGRVEGKKIEKLCEGNTHATRQRLGIIHLTNANPTLVFLHVQRKRTRRGD